MIPNVYDPQSLNRYSFERNNPLKNIDPTGHYTWLYQLATAAIRWATNYIQNIHISIPRGKAVREAITETYHDLSEKYEKYKKEKGARQVLEVSDNAAKNMEASTEGNPPKLGEFRPVTLKDPLEEEEESIDGKKIKKDKLPDANDLIEAIEKVEEDKDKNKVSSGGGGGGSSSGGGKEIPCKLNCNPKTCKATGDAKCPD